MLKLDPTIPEKLEITEVHDILWERVGQEYTTCQRISDSIWVQMASPKIALKQRGASVMIKGASFTLEFTCYHCIVYVCRDVGAFLRRSLLNRWAIALLQINMALNFSVSVTMGHTRL
jgi:hypothetical protein